MTDPEVIGDMKKFVQLNKEYKELKPIIETSERYRTAVNNLREAKDILANEKDEDQMCIRDSFITMLSLACSTSRIRVS